MSPTNEWTESLFPGVSDEEVSEELEELIKKTQREGSQRKDFAAVESGVISAAENEA